jgi:hypothetical protein
VVRGAPFRRTFVVAGAVLALAGTAGAVQLVAGASTPPVDDLEPLGLRSWVLPGIWLFVAVAVPWTVVTFAAARRHPVTPRAVLGACGLLVFELTVQIPFVGPSPLQAVLGTVALGIGTCGLRAYRQGWIRTA